MPSVFVSELSKIAIFCIKAIVLATPILTLLFAFNTTKPATQNPTVMPVLALSEQQPELRIQPPFLDINDDPVTDTVETSHSTVPDDTYAHQQWSLHKNPSIAGASGLFGSQNYLVAPTEVVVAVVDSGVMLEHEDLHFLPGYDFIHEPTVGNDGDGRDHDPSDPGDWVNQEDIDQQMVSAGCPLAESKWHGTAIAGIISATSYNATGIAGGSPAVSMLPVRVTGKCGGYVSDLIDGIRWAAGLEVKGVARNQNPANVINLSVGFEGSCSNAMQHAINEATDAGAILVTAATNSGADLDETPYSPASCENIIAVAATDRAGSITPYTALGQSIFISAPGGTVSDGIITTQNEGSELPMQKSSYGYHYGTSIAAAHVSSAIANLLSYKPDLSKSQIEQLLSVSASPTHYDPNCRQGQCGEGRLDAYAAMELLATNYLLDTTSEATAEGAPVQIAAANSLARDSVFDTKPDDEDIWTGAADWHTFLLITMILSLRIRFTRRT